MASLKSFKHRNLVNLFPFLALKRDFKLIFLANLVGSFGDGLYAYLLPIYVTETLRATPVELGFLFAVLLLVAAFTLILGGILADRYDRKKVIILGWLLWLPAPLIFASAGNWIEMIPGMVLYGFWFGGPTVTAYVTSKADKETLTLTFATLSTAWSFGYIFSPAIGGYLASMIGMKQVFYIAFVFYFAAAMALLFLTSQHPPDLQIGSFWEWKALLSKKILAWSFFFAFLMFVLLLFRGFITPFLSEVYKLKEFEIGSLGSVAFFGSAVLAIILGKIGDKWKKTNAIAVCMFFNSVALLLLVSSRSLIVLVVSHFLVGASYTVWSLLSAIIGPLAPKSAQARWVSIPQSISILSSFFAPYVGGWLYSFSPVYPFIIALVLTPLIAALAITVMNKFL
jgi:MFS family permease